MPEDGEIQKRQELPTLTDPRVFMQGFLKSKWHQEAYDRYFKDKSPKPTVSRERKEQVFLESDEAKFALVDYGTKEVHLKYNPEKFPPDSAETLSIYLDSVKDMLKLLRKPTTKEDLESADRTRFVFHNSAAMALAKEGVVPTEKLGRALARLILIDCHLDTSENARRPDIERIQRQMGI